MTTAQQVTGRAYARAGLLGNPADGYGGRAIAFTLKNFQARVTIKAADRLRIQPHDSDSMEFESLRTAQERFAVVGCDDGLRLLRAALYRFSCSSPLVQKMNANDPQLRFEIQYQTNIPRQVGLAGSSAIVIAALRAMASWFQVQIPMVQLAEMALEAEVEDLGIPAGPMDRVIQVYGGLVAMDLRAPRTEASYKRLDVALLPPLFIAWDRQGGASSGRPHGDLRARFEQGDSEVLSVIDALRHLVDDGIACLRRHDGDAFRGLMDRNFELRTQIFDVSDRDREMVALARECHASAKLCGSGGAVVGSPSAQCDMAELSTLYQQHGFDMLRPQLEKDENSAL